MPKSHYFNMSSVHHTKYDTLYTYAYLILIRIEDRAHALLLLDI